MPDPMRRSHDGGPRSRDLGDGPAYFRRRLLAAGSLFVVATLALGTVLHATDRIDLFGTSPSTIANKASTATRPPNAKGNRSDAVAGSVFRHRLRVVSHPAGARLTLEAADGSTRKARTPYRGRVREGDVVLTLRLGGYNPISKRVSLKRSRTLEMWLDPEGLLHHKVGEATTGSLPKQVAFSPDGEEIWVTPLGESGLEVYDAATLKRLAEIDTGKHGTVEVIFTQDGSTVYASQMQSASVFEIDRATYRVRRRLDTDSEWSKVMALSADEQSLFVANWSGNNITEINLTTGKVKRQLPSVATPRGLYVTPDSSRLFVAGFDNGELQRIDLDTGASKVLLTTGGAMRHLVGDPERGLLYADDMATDEVFVVDLAAESVRKLADTDHTPNTIDLTPDGKVLYVSNRGENNPASYGLPGPEWGTVLAIDTATGEILDAIVGGNQTTGLDVSANGLTLAFSDFLDNRLSLFEIPSYETLAAGDGGRAEERLEELEKQP